MVTETELKHMHADLEVLKQDIAVIKHILSEEGSLTEGTKKRLVKARATSFSEYTPL